MLLGTFLHQIRISIINTDAKDDKNNKKVTNY